MKNRYGILMALIIALMMVMLILPACSSGGEETEPVTEEEPPVAEEQEDEPDIDVSEDDAEADTEAVPEDDVHYEVNGEYVLKVPLKVREEPSRDSRQKKRSELSESEVIKASGEEDALIKAGAIVYCEEVSGDWMRIESGWICCREGENVYITEPLTLWRPKDENGDYSNDFFYDEDGEKFFITETDEPLTGTYDISGLSPDSIEFYSDGTCIYHTEPGQGVPQFDENGLCDGRYNYRKGKVYFRIGGGVNAEVYVIENGELVRQ